MTPQFSVVGSSDIVGALGDPNDVLLFWTKIVGPDHLAKIGFELIAWSYIWSHLSPQLKSQTAGLHGRTHTYHESTSLVLHLVNQFISPLPQLLTHVSQFDHPVYLLLHEPVARHSQSLLPPQVVIENDIYPGALNQAVSVSKTIGPKNLVCDLAHISAEVGLEQSLAKFSAVANCCRLVHVPIGLDLSDSLPIDIPDSYLAEVARIISQNNILPVIECQWGGLDSVFCRPHLDPRKISYFRRWFDRLLHAGLFTL